MDDLTKAQRDRHAELCQTFAAVAVRHLPPGRDVILTATHAGEHARLELVDHRGNPYDGHDTVTLIGQARKLALGEAELLTGDLLDHLAERARDGERLNVSAIARAAGVARNTIYAGLRARGVTVDR